MYPDLPTELRAALEAYGHAAYALGMRLMQLSAAALGLNADYFDSLYSPMEHKLRLAYYPEQLVDPMPGQLRNAPHTDTEISLLRHVSGMFAEGGSARQRDS